ncbi:HAMP domain-containing histidine kinase [Cohnella ginsengisoli]|uniref:histidine kinase n=1 Tax=Cohnella ginsengisoli TaxID=425004 RepID=A0A9X4KL03_9BACL|nr:HAMP domain-containing sensor histidine kinase [Cohnella ginsengisoli]MDG0794157.1 HAMP domain-containing histidine kinase [Cohnella ginsengisoli]
MSRGVRIGLQGKQSLLLALLLAAVVAALSMQVLSGIREDQKDRLEQTFARQAEAANLRVRDAFLTGERVEAKPFMEKNGQRLAVDLGELSGMPVTLYDTDGVLAGTSLPIQPRTDASDALAYTAQGMSAYITEGDALLYLAPLYNADQLLGTVQFHASLADQNAFYERIRDLFLYAGLAVLAGGFLLGYLFVRRQVSVIRRLNRAAQQIGRGEYLSAAPVRRRDELGELADGIYDMSGSISSSVTQLNEEKRKLMEAIARLTELERQQKQFIGNISHELKTPLTSIRAYADLLEMYADDPALLGRARERIGTEAARLYELVEKALQLSAMDVYDFETKAEQVALAPLLREAAERIRVKADGAGIRMTLDLHDGHVWADPDNLMHIVLNLLDNSVKYNVPGGAITLSNRQADGPGGSPRMIVEVADTGRGIPQDAQSRIFDPFYTVSGDRSRATGGTGLGLSLVRSLAEKQGGAVRLAESGPEGSRFVLELPVREPKRES